nr:condensation domain-containing protein [Nocardioides sp. zg-DK7169]
MHVPAPYDPAHVAAAATAWMLRHEGLRTTVVRTEDGTWRRSSTDGTGLAIRSIEAGTVSPQDAADRISRSFASLTRAAWPHVRLATVHREGAPGFDLVFGADHSVMDAYSQLVWFEEFTTLYDRVRAGATPSSLVDPAIASHVDHAAADRALGAAVTAEHPAVRGWRSFLAHGSGLRFPDHPDPALRIGPVTDGRQPQHSSSTWVAAPDELDRLGALCRSAGTSAQSGALAVLLLALRAARPTDRFRFVMPMHTRHDPAHLPAVGWYVGCAPVQVDLAGAHDTAEVLARIHAGVDAGKPLVGVPLPRIAQLLEIHDHPHFVVSYVDTRHIPGAAHWDRLRARTLRSPAYADDEVYLWLVRSHHGLSVSARYPRTEEADAALRTLHTDMRRVLRELLADGAQEASA